MKVTNIDGEGGAPKSTRRRTKQATTWRTDGNTECDTVTALANDGMTTTDAAQHTTGGAVSFEQSWASVDEWRPNMSFVGRTTSWCALNNSAANGQLSDITEWVAGQFSTQRAAGVATTIHRASLAGSDCLRSGDSAHRAPYIAAIVPGKSYDVTTKWDTVVARGQPRDDDGRQGVTTNVATARRSVRRAIFSYGESEFLVWTGRRPLRLWARQPAFRHARV